MFSIRRPFVRAWCAAAVTFLLLPQPATGQSIESENVIVPGVPQELRHCASADRSESRGRIYQDGWLLIRAFNSPACALAMHPHRSEGARILLAMQVTADNIAHMDKLEATLNPGITLHPNDRGYRLVKRLDRGAIVVLDDYPDQFVPQQIAMFHIAMPLGLVLSAFAVRNDAKLAPGTVVECLREAVRPC